MNIESPPGKAGGPVLRRSARRGRDLLIPRPAGFLKFSPIRVGDAEQHPATCFDRLTIALHLPCEPLHHLAHWVVVVHRLGQDCKSASERASGTDPLLHAAHEAEHGGKSIDCRISFSLFAALPDCGRGRGFLVPLHHVTSQFKRSPITLSHKSPNSMLSISKSISRSAAVCQTRAFASSP